MYTKTHNHSATRFQKSILDSVAETPFFGHESKDSTYFWLVSKIDWPKEMERARLSLFIDMSIEEY